MELVSAARTLSFSPLIDGDWAKKHTDIDLSKPFNLNMRNDLIIVEDLDKSERYSILELEERLGSIHHGESGEFTKEEEFEDAFMYCEDTKLKLRGYKMTYAISLPIQMPINIDYSKELVGVIEYLHKGTKTAIFSDGKSREWS